jgi:DNA-binding protein HU-beta
MKKSEIVAILATETDISKEGVGKVLDAAFRFIGEKVAAGEKVAIPEFGAFSRSERKEGKAKNMRTGESIVVPARGVVRFSPAQKLKDIVK